MRIIFYSITGIMIVLLASLFMISNQYRHEQSITLEKIAQERIVNKESFLNAENKIIAEEKAPPKKKGNLSVENFDESQVCKAVIATVMGRSPKIMKVYKENVFEVFVSYVLDDGVMWKYRCDFGLYSVDWQRVGGNWVKTNLDVKEINQILIVTQTHDDGSISRKYFDETVFD
ncbi:hypothetical protein APQ14_19615 [Vibrio toranzoniae]|uniref:Uncharacterized protein n=1 Tax=Vibrio toranzoniae TaxID=1194427 RepID=A0A109D4V2_9VIBR|nr:hypothetical protein [Vibrio toranzoniae]KWT98929.1 hypothetical protein APQ14_19615 [Vibrio toranzoniae]SBS39522.1 hypothetical protein VTO7225_03639 [Vibrio toranzoniae]